MDEGAALLFAKPADRGARDIIGALEMNGDDRVPIVFGHCVELDIAQDSGRTDHAVDALEMIERGFDHVARA